MPSYDAIIIGGGINGLAAAGRLAKSGQKVLVLEKRPQAGGGAETSEFAPGYRVSRVAHVLNMLDSRLVRDLQLERHGLRYVTENLSTTSLSSTGDHLVLYGACGARIEGAVSEADSAAWQDLRARLMRFAGLLKPFKQMTPPRLERKAGNDLMKVAQTALKLRSMGRVEMQEFFRLLLINVADVLEDELSDDRLKGLLTHDAVLGAYLGPRSPNSLMLLLNRLAGDVNGEQAALALPAGGMGSVALAMRNTVKALGVDLREGVGVASIDIAGDVATGVTLSGGEKLVANRVLSAINPRTTLLSLVGPRHLDTDMVRRISSIRMRGTVAKLHLALREAPGFRGASLQSRLVIAPSVRAVEDAFNAIKYGRVSEQPVMEIIVPTAFEEGFAPNGHHVLSAIVQFAPTNVEGGWTKTKPDFLKAIMTQLETYAPGIGRLVVAKELLTPADLETEYGFIGGNWHHGELAVEQMLFLRPAPGLAQYETPITNLYLAGAGSHPGGGISGAAGWNAAEHVLKRRGR